MKSIHKQSTGSMVWLYCQRDSTVAGGSLMQGWKLSYSVVVFFVSLNNCGKRKSISGETEQW